MTTFTSLFHSRRQAVAEADALCRRLSACLLLVLSLPLCAVAQIAVSRVDSIVNRFGASVGVAWSAGDTVYSVNNDDCYPLMSVFKTHCALAALCRMQRQGTPVDTVVTVRAGQMMTSTYSPMLKRYPADRDFTIPFDSLLRYSIAESDNNACDIIISLAGGIDGVNAELDALGLSGHSIKFTEAQMYADPMRSYSNCATPSSVVRLFRTIFSGGALGGSYARCLQDALLSTVTGSDKIRGTLPRGARLAHKTGTGFTLPDGTKTADNDAGVVIMPDGSKTYITILIKDTKAGDAANAMLMRQVTRAVLGMNCGTDDLH